MKRFVFCAIHEPSYRNSWALSGCLHAVMVGVALFLSHQLPTPQKAERNPIAVAFFTPQPTHTAPTHRPTMKKSPPTPTTKPKQVQPEAIPRQPTQSKPRRQNQNRQKISPQTVVQPAPKPAPQPMLHQVTNVTHIPVAQPKTVRHTSQPTVKNGTVSTQAIAHTVGKPAPKAIAQHPGITRQYAAAQVHGSPSHRKPIHVNATIDKVVPVTPRNQVVRNHVMNVSQPIATPIKSAPRRQSVDTLPSHEEERTRAQAMEVMKQHVTRAKFHTAAKHVSSKATRQQASLSSGRHVVQARTTMSYARQTRKVRPATISRSVSAGGLSPELLAFSKLLREKIARTLEFPRLAKRLGYSGTTHVALALSKTGIVRDLKISQPSGYEILDKAAIVTLKKVLQTTKPPVEIEQLVIPIAFNLKRN